jgi:hypothetical protein
MDQHNEILPRLAAFHDGQLDDAESLEIRAHLEACSTCRQRLSEWAALDRALAALPMPEAPAEVHWRTQAALARASEAPRARRTPVRFWIAAAALFVAAFVGAVYWQSHRSGVIEMAESPPAPAETGGSRVSPESPGLAEPGTGPAEAPAESQVTAESAEPSKSTASGPVGTGDTGIPQLSDWPARLTAAEWEALTAQRGRLRLRIPEYVAPLEIAEINLLPLFDDAFVAVGYRRMADVLDPGHEAAYSDPVLLTPETAYLVSNLRLEQTSLLARSHDQGPSADVVLKLAEITWRLANLTADRDDVKGAIAAQNMMIQQRPDRAATGETRLVHLRTLDQP